MKALVFTEEEIKYVKETLNIVLDDIRKIYALTPQENIFLEIEIEEEKYLLSIGPKEIALLTLKVDKEEWQKLFIKGDANFDYKGNILLEQERIKSDSSWRIKSEETYFWRNELADKSSIEPIARFLAQYDTIRKDIISHIETCHSEKEDIMSKLQHLRTIYGGEVYVNLGEAKTMNMQKIEVEEQNGKKIGTIDFGNRLVKIITEGDIVLTQIEPVKQKIMK